MFSKSLAGLMDLLGVGVKQAKYRTSTADVDTESRHFDATVKLGNLLPSSLKRERSHSQRRRGFLQGTRSWSLNCSVGPRSWSSEF